MSILPITVREFAHKLPVQQLFKTLDGRYSGKIVPKLGLCVSGGADSMALALLLRQLQEENLTRPFTLKAFVVDHQARKGSFKEAESVASRLKQMGVHSEILTMHWETNVDPSSLSDFESQARTRRYRLLARAALNSGIRELLSGHHCDDQVETVLLRLIQLESPPLSALRGMPVLSTIPCCEDIYGAETGQGTDGLSPPKPPTSLTQFHCQGENGANHHRLVTAGADPTEIGFASKRNNILLFRPLLWSSKEMLIRTCMTNGIEYVDDQTNFDPTRTIRNAVRAMRSYHKLPRALRAASILSLSLAAKRKMLSLYQQASKLMAKFQILSFDLRSGVMLFRFPDELARYIRLNGEGIASCVASIMQAASPMSSQTDAKIPGELLYSLLGVEESQIMDSSEAKFQPAPLNIHRVMMETTTGSDPGKVWRLSRQPMRAEEVEKSCVAFQHQMNGWSQWILWDSRFWIGIKCGREEDVENFRVRALREEDLQSIRARLTRQLRQKLDDALNDAAPGKIRWTLPVISNDEGVCIFPTLDMAVPSTPEGRRDPGGLAIADWKVKYKAIPKLLQYSHGFHFTHPPFSDYEDTTPEEEG